MGRAPPSAPDAVGFSQRLVNGPDSARQRRKVRRIPRPEFELLTVGGRERGASGDEVAELRIDHGAREGARRRLPSARPHRLIR